MLILTVLWDNTSPFPNAFTTWLYASLREWHAEMDETMMFLLDNPSTITLAFLFSKEKLIIDGFSTFELMTY